MFCKKIVSIFTAYLFLFQFSALAQDTATITWQATGKKIAAGQYEIHLTGTVKSGWYIYTKSNEGAGLEGFKIIFSD